LALTILREGARYLGVGLLNLVLLLDPEMIVIGGGLAVRWDQYIAHAVDFVRKATYPRPLQDLPILPAKLEDSVGIMGAVALVQQKYAHRRRCGQIPPRR